MRDEEGSKIEKEVKGIDLYCWRGTPDFPKASCSALHRTSPKPHNFPDVSPHFVAQNAHIKRKTATGVDAP